MVAPLALGAPSCDCSTPLLAVAQAAQRAAAHWHSGEKPAGPQHEASGTSAPPRVAFHLQMSVGPEPAPENLPCGSSSCTAQPK
jgi:hypothetical protein